ncbi:hypothetical protein NIES2101_01195 [Calothrix sp. HK-06]|nr:hypothetical protein NIES2101_01195 [Calothrix sp. HK-06]
MLKLSRNNKDFRYWLVKSKLVGVAFFVSIVLGAILSQPASACKPAPGSRPATLAARVDNTPYVFDGTVIRVNEDKVTVRVKRYFKGKGSRIVTLKGFNRTSCDNFITTTGARYLFFAKPAEKKILTAVYDGAFGSVREWSNDTEGELRQLGLLDKSKKRTL